MAGQGDISGDFSNEYRAVLRRSEYSAAMLKNLEDRRKRLMARLMDESTLSDKKAENFARCHPTVEDLDDQIADARIEAGEAAAEAAWFGARLDIWRTRQSTYREHLKRGQEHDGR